VFDHKIYIWLLFRIKLESNLSNKLQTVVAGTFGLRVNDLSQYNHQDHFNVTGWYNPQNSGMQYL
jgi:hypothetical protein